MSDTDPERQEILTKYRSKIREHSEITATLKARREQVRALRKDYDKTEDDLKALQSVGQIIGDVLKQLDETRYIVKAR